MVVAATAADVDVTGRKSNPGRRSPEEEERGPPGFGFGFPGFGPGFGPPRMAPIESCLCVVVVVVPLTVPVTSEICLRHVFPTLFLALLPFPFPPLFPGKCGRERDLCAADGGTDGPGPEPPQHAWQCEREWGLHPALLCMLMSEQEGARESHSHSHSHSHSPAQVGVVLVLLLLVVLLVVVPGEERSNVWVSKRGWSTTSTVTCVCV